MFIDRGTAFFEQLGNLVDGQPDRFIFKADGDRTITVIAFINMGKALPADEL
ncbi:hypothetical protein [Desulfobotulus alkaliphilus]|uniref:hypothetical protein n=1 Tax=Desulfobotulus alkaliphilus TaxID=622671 RepID=UPI001C97B395|nr:hypothetical protein [Desulfobotulus alkaliphilus]